MIISFVKFLREYTKERQAFGGPLSNMQTIRHTMADVKTEVVQTRLFTDHCMELFGQVRNHTVRPGRKF